MVPWRIHITEKENITHKVTEARSGDATNVGVVFDVPPQALPVHTKINGKNYGDGYPTEWSHSWAMRKPIKTMEKTIIDGSDG